MKNQRSLGLVVEGNSTASAVLRLPDIGEGLGPIKAGALRVARRISNFLDAGYPIKTYEELQEARLVLLRVPDSAVVRIVDEICASELVLKEMAFAICDTYLEATVLKRLQDRGASIASVVSLQTVRQSWFVVEGQLAAVRQVRRLIERNDARAFELRSGTKPLYFAAQLLATVVPLHSFFVAQQALRGAGISGNLLRDLMEEMSLEMFRAFSNGARVSWPGLRSACSRETADEYLGLLRANYPEIAGVIEEHFRLALRGREESGGGWNCGVGYQPATKATEETQST